MKDPALIILCQSGVWNKRWQHEFFNPTEKHMLFVVKVLCYKYWLVSNVGVISVLSSCVWGLLLVNGELGDSSILSCNVVQWPPWMQCMVTCNLIRDSQNGCQMVVIPVGMDDPTQIRFPPMDLLVVIDEWLQVCTTVLGCLHFTLSSLETETDTHVSTYWLSHLLNKRYNVCKTYLRHFNLITPEFVLKAWNFLVIGVSSSRSYLREDNVSTGLLSTS